MSGHIKLVKPPLPFCIEVFVPNQESGRSCVCVLGVSMLPLSLISLLEFPTVWYFLFFILFSGLVQTNKW